MKSKMNSLHLLGGIALSCVSSLALPVWAQNQSTNPSNSTSNSTASSATKSATTSATDSASNKASNHPSVLADISVTATRVPTRSNALISDVRVISRERIEAAVGDSLLDLLQRETGLAFSSAGGAGQTSAVYTRGTNSNHTLLLIDGVRSGSATTGIPDWANIPLANIERIEVLQGPASALYGSDAVGGVVQIFTRKNTNKLQAEATLSLGSQYKQISANLTNGNETLQYNLGLSRTEDNSLSATNRKIGADYNADEDAFKQTAVNFGLDAKVHEAWSLGMTGLYSQGRAFYDAGATFDPYNQMRTQTLKTYLQGKLSEAWQTKLVWGQSQDKSNDEQSAYPSAYATTQKQYLWENTVATPYGKAVLGAERLAESVDASTRYTETKRHTDSVFASLNGKNDTGLSWQGSLRRDRNSQFGGSTNFLVGLGYQLLPEWRVFGSYGSSFVAPSFNYLYYPGYANPNLQPERGRNAEVGLEWVSGKHEVKASLFRNKVDQLIVSDANYIGQNTAKAKLQGLNLRWQGQFDALDLSVHYDHLNAKDESSGQDLIRRAKNQLSVNADYNWQAWKFGGQVQHVGARRDSFYNQQTWMAEDVSLPAYTLLNLSAQYRLMKDLSLQLKVNNLTDESYETVYGYAQRGRAFLAKLNYQFR